MVRWERRRARRILCARASATVDDTGGERRRGDGGRLAHHHLTRGPSRLQRGPRLAQDGDGINLLDVAGGGLEACVVVQGSLHRGAILLPQPDHPPVRSRS